MSNPSAAVDLQTIRHSLSHVLAQAVLNLWPETKMAIGPAIDSGFYYDFLFKDPISDSDFSTIEKEMRRIINTGQVFEKSVLPIDEAILFWKERSQPFKVELIQDLKLKGETEVSQYGNFDANQSETFVDLCRGPHVASTKDLPADGFKILTLAGAYWRGDEKNAQLTRIYAAGFGSKEELKAYLQMLEEAKKRDHRKLGKELDLFVFSDLVGPGLPLWTPRGTLLRNLLDDFVWELRRAAGYEKVTIPHITKKDLYETSGHWQKFQNELFKITTREGHVFAMKPMNCPHHTQIYAHAQRSYKDLPQRYAETTMCYRDEQTGELHGLSRLRSFTQDDAHVFMRRSQVKEEFSRVWGIIDTFYPTLGLGEFQVRLSLHDPQAFEKYLGTPEMWRDAEDQIRQIATERKVSFVEAKGEAAFYGPKIDFIATDSIGREWQVATIQLDINLPERFDLYCINEQGEKERIVMIHAAIMGSIERFLSIYIEHVAGHFPLWLAPVQAAIVPVAAAHEAYAQEIAQLLKAQHLRAEYLDASDSLGKRVRECEKQRVPYVLVVGEKEVTDRTVSVRNVTTKNQVTVPLQEFIEKTAEDVQGRVLAASIG